MTMFTDSHDIQAWLKKYKIHRFTINSDLSVDVFDNVDLSNQQLEHIPVKFNKVMGSLLCSHNSLTSLEFCPKQVNIDFVCDNNLLTSLKGAPQIVGSDFRCNSNLLTSLEFSPPEIPRHFSCSANQLTSLVGAPKIVERAFNCSHNQLNTLEFFPEFVGSAVYLWNNPGLGEFEMVNDFSVIRAEHLRIQAVLTEQQKLNELLGAHTHSQASIFKL